MKFKVKDVDIATGETLVCIMNKKDANNLDLHPNDRLRVTKGKNSTIAVLDIAESKKAVPVGKLGIMEELLKKLDARQGDSVDIRLEEKPKSISIIKKKLNGHRLSPEELRQVINDIVKNKLTDIELTYFVAASYIRGMDTDETVALTRAMIDTGEVLKIDKHPIVDKHCIGGVPGNRTTMLVVPILVAAGYTIPKTSSRSITSPAGTADSMEVLADVSLSINDIKKVVEKTDGCMVWGGAVNLAPSDDQIITIERPLSIDAEGQLLASILAKKGSVSASHILIDIPVGRGAKVKNMRRAVKLEKAFKKISKRLGMKVKVMITDGSQPIGNGIGPVLEARDVMWVLKNDPRAPKDLTNKALLMAGHIMNTWPLHKQHKKGFYAAKDILESGKAYETMIKIIDAQGRREINPDRMKLGKYIYHFTAKIKGKVRYIDNVSISRIARAAGAPHDKSAGIYLYKHVGDKVDAGEKLFTIYAENEQKMNFAKERLKLYDGFVVS